MAKKTTPKGRSAKKRVREDRVIFVKGQPVRVQAVPGKEIGLDDRRTLAKFADSLKQAALPLKLVSAKPSAQMLSKEATENMRTFRMALERELKIRYEDAKWKEIRRLAHKYEVGGMPAMDELTKEEEASLTVKTP